MAETDNLRLPYLMAAQAQKHVTHNEALRSLDALVHLAIEDRDLSDPPATPAAGARYLVAAPATGDWTGHEGEIAAYQDGAWMFHSPREGWVAWVSDEDAAIVYDGTGWATLSAGGGGSVNPTPLVGVNATADTTNRLSLSSPASLFNHEGAGHQLKINKAAVSDTASLLYQTAFSGRAELGLTGDDDFHFKVSGDGLNWNEAIVIDKATGSVTFPNTTIGGSGFVPFSRGCLMTQTVGQNISNMTFTALVYDTETLDSDGFIDLSADTNRITIPANVSSVIIVAAMGYSVGSTTKFNSFMQVTHKNSGGTTLGTYTGGVNFNNNATGEYLSAPIGVSANDYFEIDAFQDHGSTRTTDVVAKANYFGCFVLGE